MDQFSFSTFFAPDSWLKSNQGPRYLQLFRHIKTAIEQGYLRPDTQLPAEREIADLAQVSRVTVRKAIAQLVSDGAISRQQGSGSYVREPSNDHRLEQSLSALTSFTEYMCLRGIVSESTVLSCTLSSPSTVEMMALGLGANEQAARIKWLRTADKTPMAIETSSLPADILPHPEDVGTSLYDILCKTGVAPIRAIQRIGATSLSKSDANLIGLPEGSAVLLIERTGYLSSGRPIEFTTGIYRSDIYDFVTELRLEGQNTWPL